MDVGNIGRMYNALFTDIGVSATQDLLELRAPSDAVVIIHGFAIFQTSDLGDSEEEVLRVQVRKGPTSGSSGSGGGTLTASPVELGDPAFGGTIERNNTTQATGINSIYQMGWNIRLPLRVIFMPKERIVMSPSELFVLALPDAPSDVLTMCCELTFEEIGG